MRSIGFIGVGIMGKSMVRNLMKNGFDLHIYARNRAKVEDVISEGAVFHDSIASCVCTADAVITIVGYPKDVEDVYYSEGGILANAKKGAVLIDMTTTSPSLDARIAKDAQKRGLLFLDAPVTGGDTGARNATLSILVGGEKSVYESCLDVFKAMGNNISYFGKAGSGQHAKLANQIAIAGTIAGVSEALAYARDKGLDLETLHNAISTGAAGSSQLSIQGKKMIAGDYNPGFFVKHFIKDMKLGKEESLADGLDLEILSHVLDIYAKLESEGLGDLGTQAIYRHYVKD